MNATIIHGDCIEQMDNMPKKSIDLTVTSPPYDNLRTYEGSLQWHEGIWKQVISGLYRVTKEGGVVIWVVGDATIKGSETGTSFKQALYAMECGFNLHDTMIYKRHSMPNSSRRYSQDFEYIFVFSKSKVNTFNPIQEACIYAGVGTSPTTRDSNGNLISKGRRIIKDTKKKSNVWTYMAGAGKSTKDKIAHAHPAIFPEQLAHDHIISWSNEGDTVFDPFLGSGTTGKIATQLNRHFIGIEKVEKYFNIAQERIKSVQPQLI